MYQRILSDPLLFPEDMPRDAMSVMIGLLQRNPAKRLGSGGAEEIKRHPFFSKHIDWHRLLAKKIQPPFKPSVVSVIFILSILEYEWACAGTVANVLGALFRNPCWTWLISTRSLRASRLKTRTWTKRRCRRRCRINSGGSRTTRAMNT